MGAKSKRNALVYAVSALAALTTGVSLASAQETSGQNQNQPENQTQANDHAASNAQNEQAQPDQVEEVIVTAERRAESLQRVPIAITAVTGEELQQAGADDIAGLKQVAPNLQFGDGPIDNFVSIRGVGAELINVSAEPGVSIGQDGVPFSSATMFDAAFMDVARVEVLRGPQGTIAGRNATGGTINIYSAMPTAYFGGGASVEVGNYDRRVFEGVISGPLIGDTLLGRLAVRREAADGWARNTLTGERFNNADNFKARAVLAAHLGEDLDASLVLEHFEDDGSPMLFALGRARPDQPSFPEAIGVPEYDRRRQEFEANNPSNRQVDGDKAILRVNWDLGPSSNLTSITGYIKNDNEGQFGGGQIDSLAVFDFLATDVDQFSQELTYTADLTDRLDVIFGGLYLRSDSHEPLLFGTPSFGLPVDTFDFTADQHLQSYAFYTQWRYRLTDSLRLTLGGRYTHDEKDYHEVDFFAGAPLPIVDASKSWQAFTPRVALDFTPDPNLLIYASASRGFKAGGINAFATSDGSADEFDPEFIWNYEVGVKANLLDNHLRATIAGFHMDYSNVQQNLRVLNTTTGVLLPNVVNASSATINGVEGSIDANLTTQLHMRAAATWLDATYDHLLTNDLVYPELGVRDFSGNRLARAPEWQYTLSADYTQPLGGGMDATFRADWQWQSKVFFSFYNHPLNSQDAYGLLNLNASIGPHDGNWRLSLFVRNAADTYYVTYAEANVAAGFPSLGGAVGQPRTYGASIGFTF